MLFPIKHKDKTKANFLYKYILEVQGFRELYRISLAYDNLSQVDLHYNLNDTVMYEPF